MTESSKIDHRPKSFLQDFSKPWLRTNTALGRKYSSDNIQSIFNFISNEFLDPENEPFKDPICHTSPRSQTTCIPPQFRYYSSRRERETLFLLLYESPLRGQKSLCTGITLRAESDKHLLCESLLSEYQVTSTCSSSHYSPSRQ